MGQTASSSDIVLARRGNNDQVFISYRSKIELLYYAFDNNS